MGSPLYIVQQIFSELRKSSSQSGTSDVSGYQCINGTVTKTVNNSTLSGSLTSPSVAAIPQDFPSLITFFFSFSALSELLKILVFGSLLETLRRLVFYMYGKVYNSFFITATFEDRDICFQWMSYWLSRQATWRESRDVLVSTEHFGAIIIEDELDDPSAVHDGRQLAYMPSQYTVLSMWYKGHWMRVRRLMRDADYGRKEQVLEICIFALSRSVLNSLLIDAKKAHQQAQQTYIGIYILGSDNAWRQIACRPKRRLNSIILDPGMKDLLIDDANGFLASKSWYSARGIPFRRGYLLYGAPGSGKTSMIHSLAGELGLDVYVISLSKTGLDDTTLGEFICVLPEKCIALMEDIDAAFSQTLNRESQGPDGSQADDEDEEEEEEEEKRKRKGKSNPTSPPQSGPPQLPRSRITLSGLLNVLDGVAAQEGRILFATTNKYDSLDPALCRPGRMDIHMEFKLASRYQAKELFKCFYNPDLEEKEEKGEEDDSGYGSDAEKEQKANGDVALPATDVQPLCEKAVFSGEKHSRRRTLSLAKIESLAQQFAEAIPEREVSMASLQGYLMTYKVRPLEAVQTAAAWVEEGRKERQKKDDGNRRKEKRKKDNKENGEAID